MMKDKAPSNKIYVYIWILLFIVTPLIFVVFLMFHLEKHHPNHPFTLAGACIKNTILDKLKKISYKNLKVKHDKDR